MNIRHLDFDAMEWDSSVSGALQKVFKSGVKQIRLLRFDDNFVEENWCQNGHIGFVLNGEMDINFNGKLTHYKKGDGIWISSGTEDQHKVIMKKGGTVELILFEELSH